MVFVKHSYAHLSLGLLAQSACGLVDYGRGKPLLNPPPLAEVASKSSIQIPMAVKLVYFCVTRLAGGVLHPPNKCSPKTTSTQLALVLPSKGNVMSKDLKFASNIQHSNPAGS